MKIISVFNNKGGVGKTTLTFHLAHALAELGKKVLIIDADPQCNLTIYSLDQEYIHQLWAAEDSFVDEGFEATKNSVSPADFARLSEETRSLHYLLLPTEEGTGELDELPPPKNLTCNLDIIPGRLTLHKYEEKISARWSDMYRGEALAIRTVTKIRQLANRYTELYNYDFVIIDTSPSLGAMNKVVISMVDGFFIPAAPDLFSLYGIRNIGKAVSSWKKEFDTIYQLISEDKRKFFPEKFVRFMGYTIYNAKKYDGKNNTWGLAQAHYNYAEKIPSTIGDFIPESVREPLNGSTIQNPIGALAVMHTHNTFPAMAQKYHVPMWKIPDLTLESEDNGSVPGNATKYRATKQAYKDFTEDLINRINLL